MYEKFDLLETKIRKFKDGFIFRVEEIKFLNYKSRIEEREIRGVQA